MSGVEFTLPDHERVKARCVRCGEYVGTYWAADEFDPAGRWSLDGGACRCDPVPALPQGAELAGWVRRSVRRGRRVEVRLGVSSG